MFSVIWKSWLSSSNSKNKKPARNASGWLNAQLQFNTLESRVVPSGGGCQAAQWGPASGQFGGGECGQNYCGNSCNQGCGNQGFGGDCGQNYGFGCSHGQNNQCGGNECGQTHNNQCGGFECGQGQSWSGSGCGQGRQSQGCGGSSSGSTQQTPVTISGTVYGDSGGTGIYSASDAGLGGSTVTLTGTNYLGQAVSITVTSQTNGAYSFAGVLPGTYSISYTAVAGYVNEAANDAPTGTVVAAGSVANLVVASGNNVTVNLPESPIPLAPS
jgi:hypothetical protein